MHMRSLKHFTPMISTGLVCLAAAVILSSCSKKPQQAIIGKWNTEGQTSVVEFRKDGTVVTTDKGKAETASYKFLDDSHLELEMSTQMGTNTMKVRLTFDAVIKDDKADLTVTLPGPGGGPQQSQTMHLVRAK